MAFTQGGTGGGTVSGQGKLVVLSGGRYRSLRVGDSGSEQAPSGTEGREEVPRKGETVLQALLMSDAGTASEQTKCPGSPIPGVVGSSPPSGE